MSEFYSALHANDVVRVGEFTLKSGQKSPIYVDFRHVQSRPEINEVVCTALSTQIATLAGKFDFICGVPIGASHYASVVGWKDKLKVLTYRKDVKAHGTKKVVEGTYKHGDRVLLIEDVVTTGNSIVDAAKAITNEGLRITDVVVLLDRDQGAKENLAKNGITMHNLWTMTGLLNYLVGAKKMTEETANDVRKQLKCDPASDSTAKCASPSALATDWTIDTRLSETKLHRQTRHLLETMKTKQSNLCVALDYAEFDKIYQIASEIGTHIAALKVHADFITDFKLSQFKTLRELADSKQFLLIEDRKLADTATTVTAQLQGVTQPSEWAHLITVHGVQGNALYEGASKVARVASGECGLLIVSEMSTEGSLTAISGYTQACCKQATSYRSLVAGFICQRRVSDDRTFVYMTPGVNRESVKGDGQGQQFRTAKVAIGEQLNDLVIVGRGVTQPAAGQSLADAARTFKEEAWAARK